MTTVTATRFSGHFLSTLGLSGVSDTRSALTNRYTYETARDQWNSTVAQVSSGVLGGFRADDYNRARAFYISRGSSKTHSDIMSSLAIDCSEILGVDVQYFLENNYPEGRAQFGQWAVRAENLLRGSGDQLGVTSRGKNSNSPISRQLRV